ncbi:MAG: tripartite tricarboxylate transporter TctB family protein [Salinarimonas sp.]|nr:tripartite tricarboxylate transporter TctB family protein [Salinarimonas sp.]
MKGKDIGDILGGALLIAIGLFAAIYAQRYNFGTAAQMGPGFFPVVLGVILIGLGVVIAVPAFARIGEMPEFRWQPLGLVMAAIILFSVTLRPLGLILATMASVFVAASADRNFTWFGRAVTSVGIAVLVFLIFRLGLGMNLPVWPRGF